MIERIQIHIESGDPLDKLMPYLEGKVFHVTKMCHFSEIISSSEIKPNNDNKFETSFGSSKNSYFKNKGCVSLFDYRNIYEEEQQKHIHKCRPTSPLSVDSGIVIFILKPDIYPLLVSWEGWKSEDHHQMVVPYVEVGYLGPIPLELVEKVITVTIAEERNSLAATLERSRTKIKRQGGVINS